MPPKGYLENVVKLFHQYKDMADKAIAQVGEKEIGWKPEPESNSIAIVMQHLAGNLRSRWTDFLASDGEKPWRDRDAEFEEHSLSKGELLDRWEKGWASVFDALNGIDEKAVERTIKIRGEPLTVLEALNRSLTHTAYHVGQIVYIAKAERGGEWKTLSIPKGKSKEHKP